MAMHSCQSDPCFSLFTRRLTLLCFSFHRLFFAGPIHSHWVFVYARIQNAHTVWLTFSQQMCWAYSTTAHNITFAIGNCHWKQIVNACVETYTQIQFIRIARLCPMYIRSSISYHSGRSIAGNISKTYCNCSFILLVRKIRLKLTSIVEWTNRIWLLHFNWTTFPNGQSLSIIKVFQINKQPLHFFFIFFKFIEKKKEKEIIVMHDFN